MLNRPSSSLTTVCSIDTLRRVIETPLITSPLLLTTTPAILRPDCDCDAAAGVVKSDGNTSKRHATTTDRRHVLFTSDTPEPFSATLEYTLVSWDWMASSSVEGKR